MIGLIQRVRSARVEVGAECVGEIGVGILCLLGVERGDAESQADRLLQRILAYRIFPDEAGRMNRSLSDIGGGLLLVSQFTLAADTRQGNRPGFSTAAAPDEAERLYRHVLDKARGSGLPVASGRFGADMQVSLINDGPVTFNLRVPPSTN